jgi:hypothetical protein
VEGRARARTTKRRMSIEQLESKRKSERVEILIGV